jgi:hypothetical protein
VLHIGPCPLHHAHFPWQWERWREDWALVQADSHDRLALPVDAPTLDCTEWVKDPGLESGFDPMLYWIWYLAKNGLTSLMVLHDFLSRCLHLSRTGPVHMGVHQGERHHVAGSWTWV